MILLPFDRGLREGSRRIGKPAPSKASYAGWDETNPTNCGTS